MGPDRLPPGLAPGGLVVHAYNRAGLLLLERRLTSPEEAERYAALDADAVAARLAAAGEPGCVLVVFDGDTGVRMVADA